MRATDSLYKRAHHLSPKERWQHLGIILGAVGGMVLITALVGCMTACCRLRIRGRKREKDMITRAAHPQSDSSDSNDSSSGSSMTYTDIESHAAFRTEKLFKSRDSELLAIDAFKGRELKMYRQQQRLRLHRSVKSSSTHLPINVRQLKSSMQQIAKDMGMNDNGTDSAATRPMDTKAQRPITSLKSLKLYARPGLEQNSMIEHSPNKHRVRPLSEVTGQANTSNGHSRARTD